MNELLALPLWALSLLVPGVAAGEALKLWGDDPPLLRMGTAVGLGFGVSTLWWLALSVLAVKGIGLPYWGLLVVGSGAVFFGVSGWRQRPFLQGPKLKGAKALLFLFASLCFMLVAYFSASPYFANLPSVDFTAHVRDIDGLLLGFPALSSMLLYYGVYFQLAPLSALGGSTLYVARYGMGVLVLLSFFLVYRCSWDLFRNSTVSLLVTAIYSLGAFVWFVDAFDVGLWANFYGLLASLFLVSSTIRYFGAERGRGDMLVLVGLALLSAMFSHYSTVLVFPALVAFALMRLPSQRKASLTYLTTLLAPIVGGVVLFRGSLVPLLGFMQAGGSEGTPAQTWLSSLMPLPSLGYAVAVVSNDCAAFVLLILVGAYVRALARSERKALGSVPLVWFATSLALAPLSPIAWRFSVVALVPLVLMAGAGLFSLVPFEKAAKRFGKRTSTFLQPSKRGLGVLGCTMWLLLLPVPFASLGSWGSIATATAANTPAAVPEDQGALVKALAWMGSHKECGHPVAQVGHERNMTFEYKEFKSVPCRYLSVAEWRFELSDLVHGPPATYAPRQGVLWSAPEQAVYYAGTINTQLLIVTKYISEPSVPAVNLTLVESKDYAQLEQAVQKKELELNRTNSVGTISAFAVTGRTLPNGTIIVSQQIARFLNPWATYVPLTMPGYNVVYQDGFVKIFCLSQQACGSWML